MKHLPNILTILRLILVPVFPLVYFSGHPRNQMLALSVYIVASITDFFDGFIARRFHLVSKVGTVLDPLADKLMLLVVLFSLSASGALPLWVFVFVAVKETFMIVTGAYMYFRKEKMVIPSNMYGKLATFLFFIAIPLVILWPGVPAVFGVIMLALLLKLLALVQYARHYFNTHGKGYCATDATDASDYRESE